METKKIRSKKSTAREGEKEELESKQIRSEEKLPKEEEQKEESKIARSEESITMDKRTQKTESSKIEKSATRDEESLMFNTNFEASINLRKDLRTNLPEFNQLLASYNQKVFTPLSMLKSRTDAFFNELKDLEISVNEKIDKVATEAEERVSSLKNYTSAQEIEDRLGYLENAANEQGEINIRNLNKFEKSTAVITSCFDLLYQKMDIMSRNHREAMESQAKNHREAMESQAKNHKEAIDILLSAVDYQHRQLQNISGEFQTKLVICTAKQDLKIDQLDEKVSKLKYAGRSQGVQTD